jgi:hypothetical protein
MTARLIRSHCQGLKPHPAETVGGVGQPVRCFWPEDYAINGCGWARIHQLPDNSPLRRKTALTAKPAQD